MRKTFSVLALTMLFFTMSDPAQPSEVPVSSDGFNFPLVNSRHQNMQRLLINAMGYLKPEHGLVDPVSGYPVEGWNQDPQRGLFMRSFTQLTAIGEQLEILANIAAGFAVNPYISRPESLRQLKLILSSLLTDQQDSSLSARGLLGNFLGFSATGRIGPLSEQVEKIQFVELFGEDQATDIWAALVDHEWIIPQQNGSFAKISRKGEYGDNYFSGALAPFSDSNTRAQIMSLLDMRVVQVIFGDNANLTASAARALGALLHASIQEDPAAVDIRDKLELFIARQEDGYRHLYDIDSGSFYFGWNATHKRNIGWEDGSGNWIVGHMDYLVNEFRGPLQFVVKRFGLPINAVKNSGFKIKPYTLASGRDVYTLATWNGSAFESLGLSLFMQEMHLQGWREILENSVEIMLDFSRQHNLYGLLSEAYSGNGVEYTGNIGIPALALNDKPRITNVSSLYSLGAAYTIAPDSIERFLDENWAQIEALFTDHGPWEGYNKAQGETIALQTTAHTLALILGVIGSAEENMRRYMAWRNMTSLSNAQSARPSTFNFLSENVRWISWSPTNDPLEVLRGEHGIRISADAVRNGAVTLIPQKARSVNLSNGALLIRYKARRPLDAVITLSTGPKAFQNEIFSRFYATDIEKEIRIPLPATPGLEEVSDLVIRFGDDNIPLLVDLTVTGFEFVAAR